VFFFKCSFWAPVNAPCFRCLIGPFLSASFVTGPFLSASFVIGPFLDFWNFLEVVCTWLLFFWVSGRDALPVTCVSCHLCFLSYVFRCRDCTLCNNYMLFVDSSLLFYWVDLRWLSSGNSLVLSVVMATGRQPISPGCGFSSLQLSYLFSWFNWFFYNAYFMYKSFCWGKTCLEHIRRCGPSLNTIFSKWPRA